MNQAHTVIAIYRPEPDCEAALFDLIRTHVPRLRELGLAKDTEVTLLRATDGSVLEIFDWTDAAAVETAHTNPEVQKIWTAFSEVCDWGTLGSLEEAGGPFPHFTRFSV